MQRRYSRKTEREREREKKEMLTISTNSRVSDSERRGKRRGEERRAEQSRAEERRGEESGASPVWEGTRTHQGGEGS